MFNGIQCNVNSKQLNSVPLDSKQDIVFVEDNNVKWVINCKYFLPLPNKTVYKCLTTDNTDDKIHCLLGKNRRKGYYVRNATRCWLCAIRHGYALRLSSTKTLE